MLPLFSQHQSAVLTLLFKRDSAIKHGPFTGELCSILGKVSYFSLKLIMNVQDMTASSLFIVSCIFCRFGSKGSWMWGDLGLVPLRVKETIFEYTFKCVHFKRCILVPKGIHSCTLWSVSWCALAEERLYICIQLTRWSHVSGCNEIQRSQLLVWASCIISVIFKLYDISETECSSFIRLEETKDASQLGPLDRASPMIQT
jgi:hypothetical protein